MIYSKHPVYIIYIEHQPAHPIMKLLCNAPGLVGKVETVFLTVECIVGGQKGYFIESFVAKFN